MNLIEVYEQFPDHKSCIDHLENQRWGDSPHCPLCASVNVKRKVDGERIGRWNCHDCKSSFNVLSGTFMQGTQVKLQKWFLAISLIMNAKKSLSSYQLARDLDLNQKTAWYMQTRIRAEMAAQENVFLQGVIEADETYVGGKPRKPNSKTSDSKSKRGRGTKKTPIIGAIQRGGQVVARVATDLSGKGILEFLRNFVNPNGSILMTDEYGAYNAVKDMPHRSVNHQEVFVDGIVHTNTIEGFWALLKRAWYGSHHHYRRRFTPLYVAEACYKYNHRKQTGLLFRFTAACFPQGNR